MFFHKNKLSTDRNFLIAINASVFVGGRQAENMVAVCFHTGDAPWIVTFYYIF